MDIKEGQTIIIRNETANAIGIAAFILGLLSIFIFSPIFVPIASILGVIAVVKKQLLWGILGLVCAIIGFVTSPILMGLTGIISIGSLVDVQQTSHTSVGNTQITTTQTVTGAELNDAKMQIRNLEAALNLYKLDNYVYPTTSQGLQSLVQKPVGPEPPNWKKGGYADKLPLDPWGQSYQYRSPGMHSEVDIFSSGPNKIPNDNDDIGNWNIN